MTLYDLTPAAVAFYEAVEGKTDEEKLEHFWSDFRPVNPAFYDLRLLKWREAGENVNLKLLEEFAEFETYKDKFVQLQAIAPKQLEEAVTSFQAYFPDFSSDFDVYLLHSLKQMNGGMRELDGKHTFIFGLDMMARFHTWENDTPFFHHELLHVYMKQLHSSTTWYGEESLLLNLWEEGLATYVSYLLNPKAPYAELMLDLPEGLPERVWKQRVFLAGDLSNNLLCNEETDYEKYFVPWSGDEVVPGRAGYFIGFMILNELAKEYPLTKLLKPASETRLLELMQSQLAKLFKLPKASYLPVPPKRLGS